MVIGWIVLGLEDVGLLLVAGLALATGLSFHGFVVSGMRRNWCDQQSRDNEDTFHLQSPLCGIS
jgi:hypothetical protein